MADSGVIRFASASRAWLQRADEFFEMLFGRAGGTMWVMPAATVLAAAALWVGHAGTGLLDRSFHDYSFAEAIARQTRELRLALVDAETGQLGFTLTGDARYLDPYKVAVARLPEIRRGLARLAGEDREGRTLFREVSANLDRVLGHWEAAIDLVRQGGPLRAQALEQSRRGKAVADELRSDMNWLERIHESRLARFQEVWGGSLLAVRIVFTVLILLIFGLFVLTLRYAHRALDTERQQMAYVESERDRLERAVRERTRELSELAGHLQRAQEQERLRVARELHDELGALLTAAKMTVAWLVRQGQDLSAAARERLGKLDGFLEQGVQIKRRVVEGLAPSALSHLGLTAALQSLAEQASATGDLKAAFRATGAHPEPDAEIAIALYRVAQEALTNVQKHARAASAEIGVDFGADWIELRVRDDGKGLAGSAQAPGKAHGLPGMRQRADSLGGTLEIRSDPGSGTCVTMRVPRSPAPA